MVALVNKVYESMMTVGPAVVIGLNEHPDTTSYQSELPQPDGPGWQLKQVIPVHNNPKYLQYFWQRELEQKPQQDSDNNQLKLKTGSINLGV